MLLPEDVQKEVKKLFESLEKPVKLVVFSQKLECQTCADNRALMEEVSGLSEKIEVEVYDFEADKQIADKYGIDKIPATVVLGDNNDYNIRYYGIPGGYEFSSLIETIKTVSTGNTNLSDETKKYLDSLESDVHLQVFVTPTCPYCPAAVVLAHHMALYSDKVKADMVEAMEFPHLANKYNVEGVPRTVINGTEFVEGAAPDSVLIEKISALQA
jgi:glutaredoxin-like protein